MTRYHFFTIAKNDSVGNSDIGPIVELRYSKYGAHQKSWVMLLFDSELYFFQNINPLRVLKYTGVDKNNSTANLDEIYEGEYVNLPWKKIYGDNLRGGTPAILVNNVYLSFFHSVVRFQEPFTQHTYFMGAISFCPRPPFHVHSTSEHPIVQEG